MNLHVDTQLFSDTIRAASQRLGIRESFIEKDYWIVFVLGQLSQSSYAQQAVFKGGTSLSKGYGLIHRFSEDVDIALLHQNDRSGSEVRGILRNIEKDMSSGLRERLVEGISSKGSRFRKTVFEYPALHRDGVSDTLIIEVNSFANPFPYRSLAIQSFISEFLAQTGNGAMIDRYGLHPYQINTLSKEQTLLEKLSALIRFSYDAQPSVSLASKIRHFYDLYYLMADLDCHAFVRSPEFLARFEELMRHDRELFDIPDSWGAHPMSSSPLLTGFDDLWKQLQETYTRELTALTFAPIPEAQEIAKQFKTLTGMIPS